MFKGTIYRIDKKTKKRIRKAREFTISVRGDGDLTPLQWRDLRNEFVRDYGRGTHEFVVTGKGIEPISSYG